MRYIIFFNFLFFSISANSQCCCAVFTISFADKEGELITKNSPDYSCRVKVNNDKRGYYWVNETYPGYTVHLVDYPDTSGIRFDIGCGVERVEITITHKKDKMTLVLLDVYGEINRDFFNVPFVPGYHTINVKEFTYYTPYTGNDFGLTKLFVGDYRIPFKFYGNKFITDTSSYFVSGPKYWHQRVMNKSPKVVIPAHVGMDKEIEDAYYMILENGDTLINEPYVKFIPRYFGSEIKEEESFISIPSIWDTLQFNEPKEIDTLNDNNDIIENPVGVYILYGRTVVFSKIGEFKTTYINGVQITSIYNGIWYRYDNRRKLVRKEIYYKGILVGYAAVNNGLKNELLQFIHEQALINISR